MPQSTRRHRAAAGVLLLGLGCVLTPPRLGLAAMVQGQVPGDAAPLPPLVPEAPVVAARTVESGETARTAPVAEAAREPLVPPDVPLPPPIPREIPKAAAAIVAPQAIARVEGTAAPGLQVTLHGESSRGTDLRYRWVQTRGPAVGLVDASRPAVRFTIPTAPGPLGFVLVVSGPNGSDTTELTIPLEGLPHAPAAAPGSVTLRADAGDDQIGLVGHQITLNGVRSEPRGRVGFRWVQTGGPAVRYKLEDGYIYAFVPTVAGVYRFALVVASGSEISQPDEVTVTIGSSARTGAGAAGGSSSGASLATEGAGSTQEVARAGLAALRGGAEVAEPLARVFENSASRMDQYRAYSDVFAEMSRRLDELLPAETARRSLWVERLFNPLTVRTLEVMRAEGLDLRVPEGQAAPLNASQKVALAELFRQVAEGLRSVNRPR